MNPVYSSTKAGLTALLLTACGTVFAGTPNDVLPEIKAIAAKPEVIAAVKAQNAKGLTLDAIKARGQVVCGVNTGLAGFSAADASGKWTGLDVDFCRAIAAAVVCSAAVCQISQCLAEMAPSHMQWL